MKPKHPWGVVNDGAGPPVGKPTRRANSSATKQPFASSSSSPREVFGRTLGYYIKSNSADVTEAMEKFEQNIAQKSEGQTFRDSERTVKTDSGATPGFVN